MTYMSGVRPGLPERGSDSDIFKEIKRRLDALETAARLPLASIGSGGLTVKDGGQILIEGAPVILDGEGLDIADGLVTLTSDGLEVDGGKVVAIEAFRGGDTQNNVSLDTTHTDQLSITLTPPAWAEAMLLSAVLVGYLANSSGGTQRVASSFRIDTNPEVGTVVSDIPSGLTQSFMNALNTDGVGSVSLPTAFDLKGRAWVTSGTNSSNHLKLTASGFWLRAS